MVPSGSSWSTHIRQPPLPDSPPPSYTPESPGYTYTTNELVNPDSYTSSHNLSAFATGLQETVDTELSRNGPRYLYYRVYSSDGSIEVKNPKFPDDPWLGCTLVHHITPPHTVARIKQHLARFEAIDDLSNTTLFANVSCPAPLQDTEFIDTRSLTGLGAVPEDPLALVVPQRPTLSPTLPRSHEGLMVPRIGGGFVRPFTCYRMRALRDVTRPASPERDLSLVKGEILFTKGVIRNLGTSGGAHLIARNASGQTGVVWPYDVEFLGASPPAFRLARTVAEMRLELGRR